MCLARVATLVAVLCLVGVTGTDSLNPLSDEFIDLINAKQSTWKAGRNFHPDTPPEYLDHLLGLIETDTTGMQSTAYDADIIAGLPDTFDARDKWPNCPSLNEIRDQADCGSCWAFAAVETMTDRVCIQSNGTKNFHFSAEDVVTCGAKHGCHGDYIFTAWLNWPNGIVSGGNYGSNEGCKPYSIPPCEHHKVGTRRNCSHESSDVPSCTNTCRPHYNRSYANDKRRGTWNYLSFSNEDAMKAEIFRNGPINCGYHVYEDFYTYTSGVYIHAAGNDKGKHAVKVIGWGVENEIKYWLVANSWNEDWGDKGFFKILRGSNHVGIEGACVAGKPFI